MLFSNLLFILYPVSAILTIVLASMAWENRKNPTSHPFILLMIATTIWTAGDWLNIFTSEPVLNYIINSTIYPAVVTIPVAWLMVVLIYMGYEHYLTIKTIALLFVIPAINVILVITNPVHFLFYSNVIPEVLNNVIIWHYSHGILFPITVFYSYLLIIITSILILIKLLSFTDLYRKQTLILFFASLIPFVFNIEYVLISGFRPTIDLTPFSFTIMGIIIVFGIFRYQLFSTTPLAYTSLFSSMQDGVFATDMSYHIIDLNPAAMKICGLSQDITTGLVIQDILPEIGELFRDLYPETEKRKEVLIRRGECERYYELSYNLLSSGKKNLGYIFTFHDISTRKLIEERFKVSQEKLQLAMEGSHVGIWEYNVVTDKISISKNFASILGYFHGDKTISSYDWVEIINREDIETFFTFIMNHITGDEQVFESDLEIKCQDKSIKWIYVRGKVMSYDDDKKPLVILGTSLDITSRKNAQESLEKINIKMNLLSSITRHDILNQVSALQSYLAFSLDKNQNEEIEKYLKTCETIVKIIYNQIEFTRIYEEIGASIPKWQNPSLIIRKIKRDFPEISIVFFIDLNGIMIYADPLLEKVFFTLVENSIRHGGRVTDVHFSFQIKGSDLILIYEDNGMGIEDKDKPRIFDKKFGKHTGFGLFLAREVLSMTGLSIIETGIFGEGVRFEISIPEGSWKIQA